MATTSRSDPDSTRSAAAVSSIIGDCAIQLSHPTTYEPPLYLFPELLPKVAQGSAPVMVWDAVADAVDVGASFWHLADASKLPGVVGARSSAAAPGGAHRSSSPSSSASGSTRPAMATLASLIASNRLLAVGLSAEVLQEGSFSSASMLEELMRLQQRAGLSEEEGAVIMTNHFVNLLAWKKLREVNHAAATALPSAPTPLNPQNGEETEGTVEPSEGGVLGSRKRGRQQEDILDHLKASPDPWSTEVDDARFAGVFVAAQETNVERKVELLETLSQLYRRPWRTLRSQGVQTDYVVPPGTVNTTSPYAMSDKRPGATLAPREDLGWTVERLRGSIPAPFSVLVSSDTVTGAREVVVAVTALGGTNFGRTAGVCHTVGGGSTVRVHVGLDRFTKDPEALSALHFTLALRPVYGDGAAASRRGGEGGSDSSSSSSSSSSHSDEEEEEEDPGEEGEGRGVEGEDSAEPRLHVKTPTGYTLWLLNYGANGVRITGKRWVLEEPVQLQAGDELRLGTGGDVRVTVLAGDGGEKAVVKHEKEEEEQSAAEGAPPGEETASHVRIKAEHTAEEEEE